MMDYTNDAIRKVTSELRDEIWREQIQQQDNEIFRPVPYPDPNHPCTWRVTLSMTFDSRQIINLDLNGEVVLGRNTDPESSILNSVDAAQLGVSRRHALLRPTDKHLYLIDQGSTNGTWINGHAIGANAPYSVSNGDIVKLGRLEFVIKIINRPGTLPEPQEHRDMAESLASIACTITSHLDLEQALTEAMNMVMSFTPSDEITIWLVDEYTGELVLQSVQGERDSRVHRLPINDTLAGKVVRSGQPLRVHRDTGDPIKIKTGYLVEAVIYVPLSAGGMTFGVLSAAHRRPGEIFTERDERIMSYIADLTAVAVQNARLYRVAHDSLTRHIKVVTALRYGLSFEMRNLLKAAQGYAGLLQGTRGLDIDTRELVNTILEAGTEMHHLSVRMIQSTALCEEPMLDISPLDVTDVIAKAIETQAEAAQRQQITFDCQTVGEAYLIQADGRLLQSGIQALLDNAIKFSSPESVVTVIVNYSYDGTLIQVCDSGVGIPEQDLPDLFTKFRRGPQLTGMRAGLGLGLEIARTAIGAHHGTINARNREDGGAEFSIRLPGKLRVK